MTNRPTSRGRRREAILGLLRENGQVRAADIVGRLGVSRQTAHLDLQGLVNAGLIERRGAGRGSHYVSPRAQLLEYAIDGLREEAVWTDVRGTPAAQGLPEIALSLAHYSVTEMVNNAIDHSASVSARVRVSSEHDALVLEVQDEGVGAFERIRRTYGATDHLDALQQLAKGKLTTQPELHSGEGIFFTSKAMDYFLLECNGLRWIVDNRRSDQAVGMVSARRGTRVYWEIDASTQTRLEDVFGRYTDQQSLDFSRTKTVVTLFEYGDRFVSRSEAKRLTRGLERFSKAIIDFKGVTEVGQGFVDQVFRVWQEEHPEVEVEPINMNSAVRFMVARGLSEG
jgi:DNA-binding Lrp family transcriptional regulator